MSNNLTMGKLARYACGLMLLVGLSASFGCASAIRTGDRNLDARLTRLMDALEAERQAAHVPGMALAIVRGDQVLVTRGFGWRDLARRQPVTPNTLFAIGSSTKPMTVALTSMLVEEGKLSWDTPISQYLPEFQLKDPDAAPTFRDVYSHRTGLTRMTMLWAANQVPRIEVIKRVVEARPYADFRQQFLYNNVTFMAGGMATAVAAGVDDWETLIRQRLLKPLNMQRTDLDVADMLADPDHAQGYHWNERTQRWDPLAARDLDAVAPAGAVNSSVVEMTRWVRMLLSDGQFAGQQILAPEQLQQMWEPQIAVGGGANYGLGWFVRYWNGFKTVEHGGNIDGYASAVGLLPDKKLGVILLQNVSASPLQVKVLPMVWEAILDEEPLRLVPESPLAKDERTWAKEDLEPYLGRYHLDQLNVDCTVLMQDDKLAVDVPGQTVFALRWPDERGRWVFERTDTIEVEFDEPVEKRVPAMTMYQTLRMDFLRMGAGEGPLMPDPSPPNKPWTEAQMSALVGDYRVAPGPQGLWKLSLQDGRLCAMAPGQQNWPLLWPDVDGWWSFEVDPNQQIRFVADEEGRVSGFAFRRLLVMPMPRVDSDDELATVLDELLAKRGGLSEQGGAWHITGDYQLVHQGLHGTYESWIDGRERSIVRVDLSPFGQTVTVTDGNVGRVDSDLERPQALKGYDAIRARVETLLRMVGDWRRLFDEAKVVREDTLDGRPVYVVTTRLGDKEPLTRYVDTETGRVLRDEFVTDANGMGSLVLTTDYDDFRRVAGDNADAGFEVPYRLRTENPAVGEIEIEIKSIETGQPWPSGILSEMKSSGAGSAATKTSNEPQPSH